MSPDMFRGLGWALVVIAMILIGLGAGISKGCNYVCNKYELKVIEKIDSKEVAR
jgi:hypothetical protein